MGKDYSMQNLQKASFTNEDLSYAQFADSDLRGADFTGANLTGADFTHVRTGITPFNKVIIFLAALAISLLSGYIAMLAGRTIQSLLTANEKHLVIAGWVAAVSIILFIVYSIWKGLGSSVKQLVIPVCSIVIILGIIAIVTGIGTGRGAFFIILTFLLVVLMFIVGTIARAAAGSMSDLLFTIVALAGGMFGKTIGGGVGTVILALACVVISKRALAGAKGFESLRMIAAFITSKFGTSFRQARLANANFSQARIYNSDFSQADTSTVRWGDAKQKNCIVGDSGFIKNAKHPQLRKVD